MPQRKSNPFGTFSCDRYGAAVGRTGAFMYLFAGKATEDRGAGSGGRAGTQSKAGEVCKSRAAFTGVSAVGAGKGSSGRVQSAGRTNAKAGDSDRTDSQSL